jgi:hypothetical protein
MEYVSTDGSRTDQTPAQQCAENEHRNFQSRAFPAHSLMRDRNQTDGGSREFLRELLCFVEVPTVRTTDAVQALQCPMRDIYARYRGRTASSCGVCI